MEPVYANIVLSNPAIAALKAIETRCVVDTSCIYLCLPPQIAVQLQIKALETRIVTIGDGSSQSVPYSGPVKVSFGDRSCFLGALITGDEVLLGAIPLEDMDLIVQPKLLQLAVNPESPNIPRGYMKYDISPFN